MTGYFIIAFIVLLLVLGGLFVNGAFRPCRKCGSRLTTLRRDDSHDRHGRLHESEVRRCHSCGECDVLKGIVVQTFETG